MAGRRHRPRARFSQNFLQNRGVIDRIIGAIGPRSDEILVEIGPGLGALTTPLLPRVKRLHVVEIDRDLAASLHHRLNDDDRLQIHLGDALDFDFTALVTDTERLRVVGNLPYHISTPLLFHLFAQLTVVHDIHFMLQRELVQRIVASPGSRTYGRLSVTAQFHCTAEKLFDVSPGAFQPVPKVTSALLRLVPRSEPPSPLADRSALQTIVAGAFSQRRKTLRNSLRPWLDEDQIRTAQVDPNRRPETLTLAEFAALANEFARAAA